MRSNLLALGGAVLLGSLLTGGEASAATTFASDNLNEVWTIGGTNQPLFGGGTALAGSVINGSVILTPHPAWAPAGTAGTGASWISFTNSGLGGVVLANTSPNPTAIVRETVTLPTASAYTLTVFNIFADDTASTPQASINGEMNFTQGTCAVGPIGCEPGEMGTLLNPVVFAAGAPGRTVFFDIVLYQGGSDVSGLQYYGELEATAPVPVPAAIPLFLSGLAGLGLTARRARR